VKYKINRPDTSKITPLAIIVHNMYYCQTYAASRVARQKLLRLDVPY